MKKALLMLSFMNVSLFSMELEVVKHTQNANKMRIDSSSTFIPNQLGSLDLYHGKKGFYIRQDDKKQSIKRYNMEPMLRDITKTQLKGFLANGYLSINKTEDGEYLLKAKQRLNGGGPIGATIGCFLGKAAVSIVGHGAIQVVGILSGPFYWPVVIGLESTIGHQIELASMAGAVAGGIALGAATGPV
jgi:hypothetical protein